VVKHLNPFAKGTNFAPTVFHFETPTNLKRRKEE